MKANTAGDLFDSNIAISLQAISGTTPIVTDGSTATVQYPVNMEHFDNIGLVLKTTGTVAGSWLLEASCNYVTVRFPGLNNSTQAGNDVWADCHGVFSTISVPAGSATTQYVQNTSDFAGAFLRITFTPTSGAGSVAAYVFRKGKR